MKSTDNFKQTIQSHLENLAQTDSLFAEKFANPEKNIDDCCTYILNTVKKSDCNGFASKEIFGMAIHYYDEDKIEVGKPVNARVVVNHAVELTEQDMQKAKAAAIKQYQDETYNSIKKKHVAAKKVIPEVQHLNLFEDEAEDKIAE